MAQKKKIEFYKQTRPATETKKVDVEQKLTTADKVEAFIVDNWQKLLVGVAALIVIIIALIVIQYVRKAQDVELRRMFADAATIEQLSAVIKSSPKHPAAYPARLSLAQKYIEAKEYKNAAATLTEIYQSTDLPAIFRVSAALNAAYALEASGDKNAALNAFVAITSDSLANEDQRNEACYCGARLAAEEKSMEQAKRLLGNVNYQNKSAAFVPECKILKERLFGTPAAKPATAPAVAKPATAPAAKPATAPAAKPATAPAAKPATAPAATKPAAK